MGSGEIETPPSPWYVQLILILLLLVMRTFGPIIVTLSKNKNGEFDYILTTVVIQVELYKLLSMCIILPINMYIFRKQVRDYTRKVSDETLQPLRFSDAPKELLEAKAKQKGYILDIDADEKSHAQPILTPITESHPGKFEEVFKVDCKSNLHYIVPGLMYCVVNYTYYFAMRYLNAALIPPLSQMKIITTAFFSFLLLRKKLSFTQILALFVLLIGAVLSTDKLSNMNASTLKSGVFIGFCIMIVYVTSGAFGNVYNELRFKVNGKRSIILQNIQLYIYTSAFYALFLAKDWKQIRDKGFFGGYNRFTILSIVMDTFIGITCSFIFKYLDNISYVFISVVCIFTTAVFSIPITGFKISFLFVLGILNVTFAVLIYYQNRIFSAVCCKRCSSKEERVRGYLAAQAKLFNYTLKDSFTLKAAAREEKDLGEAKKCNCFAKNKKNI